MPQPKASATKRYPSILGRIDRRRLLALFGLGSVGATVRTRLPTDQGQGLAASGPLDRAQAWPADLDTAGLLGWLDFQHQVGDYLARAIAESPTLFGRGDLLSQRWDEGLALWQTGARLVGESDLPLGLLIESSQPDGVAAAIALPAPQPLAELPDFLADEQVILLQWQAFPSNGLATFGDPAADTGRKLFAKLLAAAGIKEAAQAIIGILDEAGYLWLIGQALDLRDGRMLLRLLTEILDFMLGRRFLGRLVTEVGEREARRLIGRLAGRFLPYIGWTLFLAQLLWAFAEQADLGWLREALREIKP